jgi:hypothetical protein
MKTNTFASTSTSNPARLRMRALAMRFVAWFQYPEVSVETFEEWQKGQVLEDEHTAKLLVTGIIIVHLGLAVVLALSRC